MVTEEVLDLRREVAAVVPPVRLRRTGKAGAVVALFDGLAVLLAVAIVGPQLWVQIALTTTVLGLGMMGGAYRRPKVALSSLSDMRSTVTTAATPAAWLAVASLLFEVDKAALHASAAVMLAMIAARVLAYRAIRVLRRRWNRCIEPVVLIGSGTTVQRLAKAFSDDPTLGLRTAGYVDHQPASGLDLPHLGTLRDIDKALEVAGSRNLIIGYSLTSDAELIKFLRAIRTRPLEVFVVPRLHEFGASSGDVRTQDCDGTPIVWLPHREWRPEQLLAKRAFDLSFAIVALAIVSPLLLMAALMVRLTSQGPVLFRQKRVGRNGEVFEMIKIRTMRHEPDAPLEQGGGNSKRITPVGRLLRRTSVDELPQLWNVIAGHMSLVGPRPEIPEFVAACGEAIPGYLDRHRVQVGLTGWAQINRLRGAGTPLEDRARYDNYYIEHWSIWRDLAIVLRTATAILKGS